MTREQRVAHLVAVSEPIKSRAEMTPTVQASQRAVPGA